MIQKKPKKVVNKENKKNIEKNKQKSSSKGFINNFSNVTGLEAIARNNLKMSSDDEVLVIINNPKEEIKEEKTKKTGFIKYD